VGVVFIYIFIANFAYSWGPVGWVLPSEIMPISIRSKAMSISTSANWFCNFISKLLLLREGGADRGNSWPRDPEYDQGYQVRHVHIFCYVLFSCCAVGVVFLSRDEE